MVVGFALSGLVLVPLWLRYPASTADSSSFLPTVVSFLVGVAYAIVMAIVAAVGVPRRWWTILAIVSAGAACGALVGLYMRSAMLDGCFLGTGPQPPYCNESDPAVLRPVLPAYSLAGALLGLALWMVGASSPGRPPRPTL